MKQKKNQAAGIPANQFASRPRWDFTYDEEDGSDPNGSNFYGIITDGSAYHTLFYHVYADTKGGVEMCHVYNSIRMTDDTEECCYPWTPDNDAILINCLNSLEDPEDFCGDGSPIQTLSFISVEGKVSPRAEPFKGFTGWHIVREGFADGNGFVNQTVRLLSDSNGAVFLFTRTDLDDTRESLGVCQVFYSIEDAFGGVPDLEFMDNDVNIGAFLDILEHIGAEPGNDTPEKFLMSLSDELRPRMDRYVLGKNTAEDLCCDHGVVKASYDWIQDRLVLIVRKGFPFDFGRLAAVSYRMSCDFGYYEGVETMLYDGREHPFAGMFEGNPEIADEIRDYQDIRKEESNMLKIINAASDRCGFYPLRVDIIPESRIDG